MKLHKIALADTQAFSSFFIDYVERKKELESFYHHFPLVENFKAQITEKSKSFSSAQRQVLKTALTEQYKKLTPQKAVADNIERLGNEKTFTITTGHQLNIFTGPLYFIFKIVTVINACKKLKSLYPAYDFVPVYWMASEDHDYEEIRSFRLYEKKYTWMTDQKGAVGRFNPEEIKQLFSEIPGDIEVFRKAYNQPSLSAAVREYIHGLFGGEGLIAIDGDDRSLKRTFTQVIQDDVFGQTTKPGVEETNKKLEALGYHTQVFVRDINFFYLDGQIRSRIEKQGDDFIVVDTALKFSASELKNALEKEPEKFSPNVILRPLYQEMILPNLAYVGGPAEMIYWLQLKGVFDKYSIPFPALLPRNFAMVVDQPLVRKWEKTKMEIPDLFREKNFLFNTWVLKNTHHDLTLGKELRAFKAALDGIRERAHQIDSTLGPLVSAEEKRIIHSLEKVERKMLKAEKRLHADKLKQIEAVKDSLFPGGGLQERTDNFLNFSQKDPAFITTLLESLDPFDFRFNILWYD